MRRLLHVFLLLVPTYSFGQPPTNNFKSDVQLYTQLHANPELSRQEEKTAAFLKQELQATGCRIVDSLGYHSFAAIMTNGNGPVIWYRTDMDALPVKEETGWSFASKQTGVKDSVPVPVMHACGHDLHMTVWLSTAKWFAENKKLWKGTLVLLAQSAEETGQGAKQVLAAKQVANIPPATYNLAIHTHATLKSGEIGFCDGYAMAGVDLMNIKVLGKGGHGAMPQNTVDPILLSAQYVTALQSIVSRNITPGESAVVTVGAIHGGTVGNIIPNEVNLALTIRSYAPETRTYVLNRIEQIGNNLSLAAGNDSAHLPKYTLLDSSIPPVYNDPAEGAVVRKALAATPGLTVKDVKPVTIGEDFGLYSSKGAPAYLIWVGTAASASTATPSSLHTATYAPDYVHALPAGEKAITTAILSLLKTNK